ncbi:hypothetical protein BDV59DRAFT_178531, partial [Aspergillus ambiguus]|uniref:uncharacterized protein n=1 Tax=Aspergillus ambiguus TaxID=176160 RepID=UPI003CCDC1F2
MNPHFAVFLLNPRCVIMTWPPWRPPERAARSYRSLFRGCFARVIADEALTVKTIRTRNYQAVSLLEPDVFWGLTAGIFF